MPRAVVLAAALLLGACDAPADPRGAAGNPSPAAPTAPGADVTAEAVQLRTDVPVGGRFQVRVTNTSGSPVTVSSVALDSAGFAPRPPTDRPARIAPGRVVDLPTPYGDPRCDAAVEPAVVVARLEGPGVRAGVVRLPLAADVLVRIHAQECAERGLAERLEIRIADLVDGAGTLTGRVELVRRAGAGEVRAERIARSVLVDVAVDLPIVLPDGESRASAAVTFAPATCEAHVLAETKQPFVFPLAVRFGDAEEVVVDLPVTPAVEGRLAALVDRVCTVGRPS